MSYGRAKQAETPLLPLQPVVDIPVHEIPGEAVALLDLAFELVALAGISEVGPRRRSGRSQRLQAMARARTEAHNTNFGNIAFSSG